MDLTALTQMPVDNLQSMLKERQEELRQLRFKTCQAELKDIRKIRNVKRNIAQILTILTQKKEI